MEKQTMKWVVLRPENTKAEIYEVNPAEDTYPQMKALVGGWIEHISAEHWGNKSILSKYDLWINEEGLLEHLPLNVALNPIKLAEQDYNFAGILVGTVFVTGVNDEGETIGVDEADIPEIMSALEGIMLCNQYRKRPVIIFED